MVLRRTPFVPSIRYASSTLAKFRDAPLEAPPPTILPDGLYPLVMHPITPVLFTVVYLAAVTYLNAARPDPAKNRLNSKAGKAFVAVHNALLALYSGWTFIGIAPAFINHFISPLAEGRGLGIFRRAFCDAQGELWQSHIGSFGYLFYLSKYYEIIDTAIILAKGKKAATLQVYHHIGAWTCMWFAMRYHAVPIWSFVFLNSLIHTIMYTYYLATTLGLPFPGLLKRSLTSMQISQFVIGIPLATTYLFVNLPQLPDPSVPCGRCVQGTGARAAVVCTIVYLGPLLVLFARFFIASYLKPQPPRASKSTAERKKVQ